MFNLIPRSLSPPLQSHVSRRRQ